MKSKPYIILFLLLTSLVLNSQNKTEQKIISKEETVKILQNINQWFSSTPTYSFEITHATYAGHFTTAPYEQKKGFFKKYSSGFHSNIAGVQSVQNKNFLVSLDTGAKIIVVSEPVKNFENNGFSLEETKKLLERCINIKQTQTEQGKTLRMEFSKTSPIAAYEFIINKSEHLQSIIMYYANEVKTEEGKMVKPRLSISFSNYATNVIPGKEELSESKYFTASKDLLRINEHYKNYELLDHRINNAKP